MELYFLPQFKQVNLVAPAGITAIQTAGIKVSSVDGIDITLPGIICLDWAIALDLAVAEWITYTSIDANDELVGVVRGAEGYPAKEHGSNAVIAWTFSKSHINNLNNDFLIEHNSNGTHKDVTVTTLKATGAIAGTDGWTFANQTWTRESDNSFSEPVDATLKYQKGDKIKYKQGAGYKYQYVLLVGAYSAGKTIITTTGGSDYVFTSGTAITDNYYSHASGSIGFPFFLNCAVPVWDTTMVDNGTSGQQPNGSAFFRVVNTSIELTCRIVTPTLKVGAGTLLKFTVPATLPNIADSTFSILGPALVSGGNLPGVCFQADTTHIFIVSATSIADNADMQLTSAKATYKF